MKRFIMCMFLLFRGALMADVITPLHQDEIIESREEAKNLSPHASHESEHELEEVEEIGVEEEPVGESEESAVSEEIILQEEKEKEEEISEEEVPDTKDLDREIAEEELPVQEKVDVATEKTIEGTEAFIEVVSEDSEAIQEVVVDEKIEEPVISEELVIEETASVQEAIVEELVASEIEEVTTEEVIVDEKVEESVISEELVIEEPEPVQEAIVEEIEELVTSEVEEVTIEEIAIEEKVEELDVTQKTIIVEESVPVEEVATEEPEAVQEAVEEEAVSYEKALIKMQKVFTVDITPNMEKVIEKLVTKMGGLSSIRLPFHANEIKSLGRKTREISTTQFLGYIFKHPHLIKYTRAISRSSFRWNKFSPSLKRGLAKEAETTLFEELPAFAEHTGSDLRLLRYFANEGDWNEFLLHLLEKRKR